ncbi:unnamed protein product [Nesidiocoris tenuis]|uniref:Integrase catalytic domain-containing protein n=1 Tax=Nesidiocoris tenuis TaxID=355587 RepID=A0A6H5GJ94_9HEMI|nr:unnamed protein product [Nesidiocoris tenuis]
MDKLLKPDRLEVDPASSNAARQWKHWKTTFTNFLNHIKDLEEDSKLPILINHVSPDIYRLFIDCTNYNDAIRQLESVYVKPKNEIFNRHRLATRLQKPGETLDQYLDALKEIGRECDFKAVTADTNRDEYIRDSFIRGLHASGIRQRLLENLTLTLGDAYNQARSLEMAQVQAQTYQSSTPFIPPVAVADSSPPDLTFSSDTPSASIRPRAKEQACYFCGGSRHSRSICPAKKQSVNFVVKKVTLTRPGKQNSAADALSRVKTHTVSAVHSDSDLMMLHIALCHPGVTRFAHWVRVKNLPYSIEDVRRVTSSCDTCKELKPQFFKSDPGVLVKATTPFERLNIDFKGPLPRSSSTGCSYMLTVVDEYSRFPFAFPCRDLSSKTVIKHLTSMFSVFGSPAFIHSDRGTAFMSQEFKDFLLSRKIATSRTTAYNPQGNGQVEKYNGTIWNAVRLALHSKGLPLTDWELMLDDALHSIRSLLCTATNNTPHERMFSHVRRSSSGCSLPSWLCQPGNKVYMKRHVRNSKYDPAVDEVDLIEVNPEYAFVKLPDGRETTVSLKHLAPSGVRASGESFRASHDCNGDQETSIDSTEDTPLEAQGQQSADHQGAAPPLELPELRRSQRIRQKPQFFGDPVSH